MHSEVLSKEHARNVATSSSSLVTPPEERKSSLYLTKFEIARIVGERAREIVNGTAIKFSNGPGYEPDVHTIAERCQDPDSLSLDPVMMAKVELLQGKIPMVVSRVWPDGTQEIIPVRELLVDPTLIDFQY